MKVKVSFTDNNGNAEVVVSDASAVVGSVPNRPAQFDALTTSREVEETAGEGENIGGPVDATDTESDPLAYSIKNDSGLFAIDPHSGQLRTNGALDYETRTSHTVVVQVTDNKDIDGVADTVIDDEIRVTVNVLAVDEPPVISGPQTVDWNENRAGTIASFTARDPERAPVVLTLVPGRGRELLPALERPAELPEHGAPQLRDPGFLLHRTRRHRRPVGRGLRHHVRSDHQHPRRGRAGGHLVYEGHRQRLRGRQRAQREREL